MGAVQALQAGGFSQSEVNAFAAEKRTALLGGGFSDKEADDYLGDRPEPDHAGANKALARTIGNAMKPAVTTVEDMASVYAPIETALNVGTGLLFGFPAYIGAAVGGLADKYLLGQDVDPKEMAETISKIFTYIPQSERGRRLTGNVLYPLQLLQEEVAPAAGHAVTDTVLKAHARGAVQAEAAPVLGAITDAAIGFLPAVLLGALGRRMAGTIPSKEDFANTAKVVAGDGASADQVATVESNLRETYEKTGIDPFTVAEDAAKNETVQRQITTPAAGVPEPYITEGPARAADQVSPPPRETAAPGPEVSEEPLLDLSGSTAAEFRETPISLGLKESGEPSLEEAATLRLMAQNSGWIERGGQAIRETSEYQTGGDVVGRTTWQGRPDWAKESGLTPDEIKATVEKFLSGQRLGKRQRAVIGAMQQEIADVAANIADLTAPADWGKMTEAAKEDELDKIFGQDSRGTTSVGEGAGTPAAAAEMGPGFRLEGDTEAGIRARETAQAAAVAAEQRRASAPAPESFRLTGSERTADVGAASGQADLQAGLNVAGAAKAYAETYTPYVGVERPQRPAGETGGFVDSLQKVLAPGTRGPIAAEEAGIIRANLGAMAHDREVALEKLKGFAADFDKRSVEDSYVFIDAMERGTKLDDPKLQAAADEIRALLDQKREDVQALGKGQLENFIENYFPHIWRDDTAAQAFYSRRPLAGSGAFLKHRTIDFFQEGIAAGLEPITTNPVELALLKAREMDRYVYGQNIFEEMKDADLARFVRFGERGPTGWTKINDKIGRVFQFSEPEQGMIVRGEYYAPDEAATLINNHLSPGLQGNAVFDAWRGIGMAMNTLQLGMSLFHVGFTTLDSMVSRVALGVKQVSRGDILEGAGSIAAGVAPSQPFVNLYKGDRLLRAYLGKLDDPDLSPVVQAIMDAGGRVRMDDFYRNATVNAFKQAVRSGETLAAAKAFLPTVLDRINAPIFEQLVPRQKLGVFFDMAKDWIAKNPEADVTTRREELSRLWDSVDNRMGQLVYDNVFWHRALKDGLMATVRSVGWNLGTFRELGGGVADIKQTLLGGPLTDRTAYVVALPLLVAMYGAITQYAYTGEGPSEMKDLFFPRTGRTRPDGSEDRVSLPTYMKDVYAYGEDLLNFYKFGANPTQTLQNKAHPLISTVSQMLNNEDFYGATIRNPSAPAVQQVQDEANYLIKQIEPFSLRNYLQQAKLRGVEPSMADYLTSPAMIGVTPSPGYITKTPEQVESTQVSKLRDPLIKSFRQQIRDGKDAGELIPDMLKAGLTRRDIQFVIRTSSEIPRPHRLKSFGKEEE